MAGVICSSCLACSMEHPQLKEAVSHLDHIIPKSRKKKMTHYVRDFITPQSFWIRNITECHKMGLTFFFSWKKTRLTFVLVGVDRFMDLI